jgi:hypothetical protein
MSAKPVLSSYPAKNCKHRQAPIVYRYMYLLHRLAYDGGRDGMRFRASIPVLCRR